MEHERSGELAGKWRRVLGDLQDGMLRGCLPASADKLHLQKGRLVVVVDSHFKRDHCHRKLAKLAEVVQQHFGDVEVQISELPLIEQMERADPVVSSTAQIVVVGLGAGGVNALDRMLEARLQGVRLIAADTDSQKLFVSKVEHKVHLGRGVTHGRSTGSDIAKGKQAAEEAQWEVQRLLEGVHLVFIACGLGGGTGTGGAPVLAKTARELGALTVGVVTLPFEFENPVRAACAQEGLARLRREVDVLIAIKNDRLLEMNPNMQITKAFELANEVLLTGVRGISDLITIPGLVNLDFADVAAVLRQAGTAMMGTGEAQGDNRALRAAKAATANPLFESGAIKGARKALVNITGGDDLTLTEVMQVTDTIRRSIGADADLTFGAVVRNEYRGQMQITLIAADFRQPYFEEEPPKRTPPPERPLKSQPLPRDRADIPAYQRRRQEG